MVVEGETLSREKRTEMRIVVSYVARKCHQLVNELALPLAVAEITSIRQSSAFSGTLTPSQRMLFSNMTIRLIFSEELSWAKMFQKAP